MEGHTINSMSIGRNTPVLEWCQKTMALNLFEVASFELHTLKKTKVPVFRFTLLQRWFSFVFLHFCFYAV